MPKIVSVISAENFVPPVSKTHFIKLYITHNSRGTFSTGEWHDTAQQAIDYKDKYEYHCNRDYTYIILEVDPTQ